MVAGQVIVARIAMYGIAADAVVTAAAIDIVDVLRIEKVAIAGAPDLFKARYATTGIGNAAVGIGPTIGLVGE
jgi:hypothetical protein